MSKPKRERRTKILQSNWDVIGEDIREKLLNAKTRKKLPSGNIYPDVMDVVNDDPWVYIIPGICDGVFLEKLIDKTSDDEVIILLEKSPSILRYALSRVDISVAILTNRIILIDTEDPSEIVIRLQLSVDRLSRGVKVVKPIWNYDNVFWSNAARTVMDYADAQKTLMLTQMTNSKVTADNILGNTFFYLHNPTIENLKDCVKEKSATLVTVAAGPSVDDVLPGLNQLSEMPPFVTCLTMLKPLLANGIKPAYVTALDYHEISGRFLDDVTLEQCKGVVFLMDPKVNPAVIEAIQKMGGKLCFFSDGWLNELCGLKREDYISGCSTVAHLSFQVAAWLGAENIIMIGNDLSFPEEKYYAEAVYEHHKWKESSRLMVSPQHRMLRVCKNKSGDPVYSDEQMVSYLKQFEMMWRNFDGTVVDCSHPKSVKKAHCEEMTLEDAIKTYKNSGEISFPGLVKQGIEMDEVFKSVDKYLGELDRFIISHKKIVNAYMILEGKFEDETLWNKSRAIIIKEKKVLDGLMHLAPRIESFSGIAEFIKRWEDTICKRNEDKWDKHKIKEHRFGRDIKYISTIQNSAEKMYEIISEMRDGLKNKTM